LLGTKNDLFPENPKTHLFVLSEWAYMPKLSPEGENVWHLRKKGHFLWKTNIKNAFFGLNKFLRPKATFFRKISKHICLYPQSEHIFPSWAQKVKLCGTCIKRGFFYLKKAFLDKKMLGTKCDLFPENPKTHVFVLS
jgi:hypothetical protein